MKIRVLGLYGLLHRTIQMIFFYSVRIHTGIITNLTTRLNTAKQVLKHVCPHKENSQTVASYKAQQNSVPRRKESIYIKESFF